MEILNIVGIILFLLILLFLMKLTVNVQYYHAKDNDDLSIEIRVLFGLIKYKKKIPLIKIDNNSPTMVVKEETEINDSEDNKKIKQFSAEDLLNILSNTKELLQHVTNFNRIMRYFFSKVTVKNIEWHTIVGLGDAAQTGTIAGALWGVKGAIIGILSHHMKMKNIPKITINPQFQLRQSETLFKCMFQFRLGNAIVAGIKIVKFWKGGFPKFKSNDVTTSVQK
ncbi:DUF2953 domain-containing protein [Niallia sp. 01092]|uniref:DUF2953 domain-containing protein n=1 Tax=unclassified Niallia TaxID=2837522 RepID=UPI003FD27C83